MKWLALAALSLVLVGAWTLVDSARDLGQDVAAMSTDHAVTAGAPRLVNEVVPVTDNVAVFTVHCDSEVACGGTMTVSLGKPARLGTATYSLAPNATSRVGVLLPAGASSPRRGKLTWREASGAEASTEFRFKR